MQFSGIKEISNLLSSPLRAFSPKLDGVVQPVPGRVRAARHRRHPSLVPACARHGVHGFIGPAHGTSRHRALLSFPLLSPPHLFHLTLSSPASFSPLAFGEGDDPSIAALYCNSNLLFVIESHPFRSRTFAGRQGYPAGWGRRFLNNSCMDVRNGLNSSIVNQKINLII